MEPRNLDLAVGGAPAERPFARVVFPYGPASDSLTATRTLWESSGDGLIRWRWEGLLPYDPREGDAVALVAIAGIRRQFDEIGLPETALGWTRAQRGIPHAWWTGRFLPSLRNATLLVQPHACALAVGHEPTCPFPTRAHYEHHLVVLGASGAGKTATLARIAEVAVRAGHRIVGLDLHGDLAPAILDRFLPDSPVLAIDPTLPGGLVGLEVLGPTDPIERPRRAAQLVATLRRLSSDNGELYWGFRLERIFDTFVRLALEEGGSLLDVYGLLTDERRREASRYRTRDIEVARFLEELPTILRRNPEFLWAAAARLSKIVQDRRLAALLAPVDGGLDVDDFLESGDSLLVRLPVGEFGPEGAGFAASLILGRLYHVLARPSPSLSRPRPTLFVLDEGHLFAPRLLLDLLGEGRKFGLFGLLATQYAERLAPELRAAAAGSVGTHLLLRTPRANAGTVSEWVGLTPEDARRLLPVLPVGSGVLSETADGNRQGRLIRLEPPPPADGQRWIGAVQESARKFGLHEVPTSETSQDERRAEAILLAVLGAEARGSPLRWEEIAGAALELSEESASPVGFTSEVERLKRRGYLELAADGARLAPAGRRFVGLDRPTGATSESALHRALVFATVAIFARHGARLEVIRQGRFDRRLPDAWHRPLEHLRNRPPAELAEAIDRSRSTWAWRHFGGRDVFVEAEVSGAFRSERLRRGLAKARAAQAIVLFVVPDAARARRVRRFLELERAARAEGRVWTIPRLTPSAPSPEAQG